METHGITISQYCRFWILNLLSKMMKNTLSIKREYWPEVTDMPHFIVKLYYEGCKTEVDDIYFDN